MKERILEAYNVANALCLEYTGGNSSIPDEDQAILDKYLAAGVIQYANIKKGKLSKSLYYPSLEHKAFKNLSGGIWLRIMRHAMKVHGIESGLSENSMKEYVYRPWQYNIEPKVIRNKEAGTIQTKAEEEALYEIIEEME